MNQEAEDKKIYIISSILFILALLWTVFSYYVDDDGTFTQRAGAVIVLFGVIVEYNLQKIQTSSISSMVSVTEGRLLCERIMPSYYFKYKMIAHFYIVIGTLIWCYVDLLWKP